MRDSDWLVFSVMIVEFNYFFIKATPRCSVLLTLRPACRSVILMLVETVIPRSISSFHGILSKRKMSRFKISSFLFGVCVMKKPSIINVEGCPFQFETLQYV